MQNRNLIALVLLLFPVAVTAQEPKPAAGENQPAAMETTFWRIPPGSLTEADPSSKEGKRKPIAGVRVVSHNAGSTQYDVVEWLKNLGVKFPEGAFATYDANTSVLVVRDTRDNLDLVEVIASGPTAIAPLQIEIELSALECSFPRGKSPLEPDPLTYADIEKLPAQSVKLLDRILASGKSGERFVANHISRPAGANGELKFAPGESGTILEVEPVVASDASYCDVNISYQFRKQIDDRDAKTLREINFNTSFTAAIGTPLILDISTVPDREGTFIVVTVRVNLSDLGKGKANADGKAADDAVSSPKK